MACGSNGSAKGRRKCRLSIQCLHPRVLIFLALALLITSVTLFLARIAPSTSWNSPTILAEPQRNYGIVVDAGSSSSKVHLFQWPPHDGDPAKLLTIKPVIDELGDPRIKKVEPGIATFANSPETAFTSIQPLLEYAMSHIPPEHHPQTLLYIFCTAGMRLLPQPQQDEIIQVLQERVVKHYPFHLPKDGIQVISGKLEGVFSWITLNYLLGNLSPEKRHSMPTAKPSPAAESESSGSDRLPSLSAPPSFFPVNTVGCLDMGGASLQVAFEVPSDAEVPADSTVEVNLGCGHGGSSGGQHKHRVFVSTYLGYGTNQARTRYYQQLLAAHLEKSNETHLDPPPHLHTLRDPCAPLGFVENITIDGHTLRVKGLGDFGACKTSLLSLLQNPSGRGEKGSGGQQVRAPCTESDPNCSRIQVFQRPPLFLKYQSLDFYGTSEIWYTMRDVLRIGGHYTSYSFEEAATKYCQTDWKFLLDRFLKKLYIYADYYRLKSQCMKSAWLSVVLHEGLGFSRDSISLHSIASIEGQSVQWALGALLYNTRYLPLREVQLHQLQAPPLSQWDLRGYLSSPLHSSFLLPFLTVLCVASLLLCCRHRRRRPRLAVTCSDPSDPAPDANLHRSQSLNSLVRIHRRMSSVTTTASAIHIAKLDTPPPSSEGDYSGRGSSSLGVGLGSKLKFIV